MTSRRADREYLCGKGLKTGDVGVTEQDQYQSGDKDYLDFA